MDPYVGEIRMVGFNFAPNGWALCNGQLLPIAQYSALFSLLGTTFGGNGTSNFALPNLQGRVPLGVGQGIGLPVYNWGQMGGQASLTLLPNQLPSHTHTVTPPVSNANATADSPVNAYPAVNVTNITGGQRGETAKTMTYASAPATGANSGSFQTSPAGASQPISIEPAYLAVYFIIALNGVFPSRP